VTTTKHEPHDIVPMSREEMLELYHEIKQLLPNHVIETEQYTPWPHYPQRTDPDRPWRLMIRVPHTVHHYVYEFCNDRWQWEHFWKPEHVAAIAEANRPKQEGLL
jgi:hypothetical protein